MSIWSYLILALSLNLFFMLFIHYYRLKSLVDFSYPLAFITLLFFALYFTPLEPNFPLYLLTLMITLWASRLWLFLFVRRRYFPQTKFINQIDFQSTSLMSLGLKRSLTIWLILLPSLFYFNQNPQKLFLPGLIIWLIGISLESIADWQKFQFKKDKEQALPFIHQGLWRYSRHPNYFGEILCWLGLYLYTLPSLSPTQQFLALLSPLTIFALLFFYSGIPLLEKSGRQKWGHLEAYQRYLIQTSLLIPLLPKGEGKKIITYLKKNWPKKISSSSSKQN